MSNGKFTLLQVVQKTLESLNLNQVNSISDSEEASQIAIMAEDAYYELMNQREWPHLVNLKQLESVADADHPNYLRIPDDVVRIDQVRYDNTDPMGPAPDLIEINSVRWLEPEAFLVLTQSRNTERDDVTTITDFSGVRYHIIDELNKPQWWTSFDDEYVVFDAFRSDVESTLQGNKSQALCKTIPNFVIADSTVADMPAHVFQIWIAEVKSTAMLYIRQEVSAKDEQRARRGLAVARRDASRTDNDDGKVRFGRPSRGVFFATSRRIKRVT